MVEFNIDFNKETFALGVATGWATAYGVYRARHIMSAARRSLSQQASSAQDYATRSAGSRYVNDLIKECETGHLAGKAIPLQDILVEPRFLKAPPLAAPKDDDVIYSVFHVVPTVPDHPYLQAPYNVETLSIEELGHGDRAIALLGQPGSGRSTALRAIALWSMGKLAFKTPVDKVQQQLEQEEEGLSDEERAKRIKERLNMEQVAAQSLAKGRDMDLDEEARKRASIPLFKRLTPVYVHLGNVNVSTGEFGRHIDPAEPLVRAVQHHVSRVTARTIPRTIYQRLAQGDMLLLLDGFDDLPEAERDEKAAWLQAFLHEYGNNFIIVTGPASGYGKLVKTGFTPVFLRPWHDVDMTAAADKWKSAWPRIRGARRRDAVEVDEKTLKRITSNNRARSAFELTAKFWSMLDNGENTTYEGWLRSILERFVPVSRPLGVILPQLAEAAAIQLNRGYITASDLELMLDGAPDKAAGSEDVSAQNVEAASDDHSFDSDSGDELDALFEGNEAEAVPAPPVSKSDARSQKKPAKSEKESGKFLADLTRSGLFVRFRGDRYQFRHVLLASYLASLTLKQKSARHLLEIAQNPAWSQALSYATMHMPLDQLVEAFTNAPPDVLENRVLEVARWLSCAEGRVEWRPAILKLLGNMFVGAAQYPLVRERVAAALVGTRDKNVPVIFKRALRHPDDNVRRLACLGLGAMRQEDAIEDIASLLEDVNNDVQLAAGLALGAIGTEPALHEMVIALTQGSEQLRKAIAEAFAAIPDEGYPILYDAVNHEEMMLRRAAVYGLRRINTPWALIAIYRRSLEDDQWYVRSAAEQAFLDMQYGETAIGPRAYPSLESIPWLKEWAATLDEEAARQVKSPQEILLKALNEGAPEIQRLSVANIGQLGLANHMDILYSALRHQNEEIRETAFRALGDLQLQIGRPLPAPA